MAGYSNENLLRKILEIQNIVLSEQKRGFLNQKEIFHQRIAPKYFICIATFYNYMARNAKKELADIEERRNLRRIAKREREKVVSQEIK